MKGKKFGKQSDSADKFQVKWAYGAGQPPCQPHPLQPSRINSTDWECLYSGSSPTWEGQCVMDQRSPRVLPDVRLVLKKDNTPTLCISKCKGKGFAYAGVEYGWECFCANVPPPSDAIVDKKQCNKKCSGDQNMICGGSWRINVFKTGIMNHFNCLNNWDSNFKKKLRNCPDVTILVSHTGNGWVMGSVVFENLFSALSNFTISLSVWMLSQLWHH